MVFVQYVDFCTGSDSPLGKNEGYKSPRLWYTLGTYLFPEGTKETKVDGCGLWYARISSCRKKDIHNDRWLRLPRGLSCKMSMSCEVGKT